LTETPKGRDRTNSLAVVGGLLAVGLVVGLVLALVVPVPSPPPPHPGAAVPPVGPLIRVALVLAGIDLVVLLGLVFVYVRTYLETRARFALGLVVFLAALTVQTVVGSPIVFGAFGYGPGSLAPFIVSSYVFETVAVTIFLFLSLE
jgi:hypothetical protein